MRNQYSGKNDDSDGFNEIVDRFRNSLLTGRKNYFDVSEFEGIVDYLLDEGDLKTSEIAILQGMQIHPAASTLKLKYAQILLNKGKYDEALKLIDKIEDFEKENSDFFLVKGTLNLLLGFEPKAKKCFEQALALSSHEMDEIYFQIATAYVFTGKIKKAISYFEKCIEINPENDFALGELGFFSEQVGDFKKSILYYNKFLDIDPYNSFIWMNLGISYNHAGEFEKAVEAFEFSLTIDEDFHQAKLNMANALANLRKYDEAIRFYMQFLEKYPENDDAHCFIGECYLNLDNYAEAEKWYRKAAETDKLNDNAWFGLGLVSWFKSDYKIAATYIHKAIRLDNMVGEYWITLAKVYVEVGRLKDAESNLKKASLIEPENPEVWLTWCDIALKESDALTGVSILETGMRKCTSPLLKYRIAGLLMEEQSTENALPYLKKAMKQDIEELDYFFELYPQALKNEKIMKLVRLFRKKS